MLTGISLIIRHSCFQVVQCLIRTPPLLMLVRSFRLFSKSSTLANASMLFLRQANTWSIGSFRFTMHSKDRQWSSASHHSLLWASPSFCSLYYAQACSVQYMNGLTSCQLLTLISLSSEVRFPFAWSMTIDLLCVKGGTAGNVLANRLTEDSNISVLVLEAGGS